MTTEMAVTVIVDQRCRLTMSVAKMTTDIVRPTMTGRVSQALLVEFAVTNTYYDWMLKQTDLKIILFAMDSQISNFDRATSAHVRVLYLVGLLIQALRQP